jgi:hypothetical protein
MGKGLRYVLFLLALPFLLLIASSTQASTVAVAPPDSITSRILSWCAVHLKESSVKVKEAAKPAAPIRRPIIWSKEGELREVANIEASLKNFGNLSFSEQIDLLQRRADLLSHILIKMAAGKRSSEYKAELVAYYPGVSSSYEGIIKQVISDTLATILDIKERQARESRWEEYWNLFGTPDQIPRPVPRATAPNGGSSQG